MQGIIHCTLINQANHALFSHVISYFTSLQIKRPERQQAVALWWKSKPTFKEHGRQASLLQLEGLHDKGK